MKKRTLFWLLLVVAGTLFCCTALAAGSLDYRGTVKGDAVLTGPGELVFEITITNIGDEDMPGPVHLYYPDMTRAEGFGSPVLAVGESKTWEGTWSVTQKELEAGYVGFIVERTVKDPETGELTTKTARLKLEVTYNAAEGGTTAGNGSEQETGKDGQGPMINEFIFRGKIRWSMNKAEVVALEGEPASETRADLYTGVRYANVPVSNCKGNLDYIFIQERLVLSVYRISDTDQTTFDYLREALKVVYGDEAEADKTEFSACLNKLKESSLSEESQKDWPLARWETPDGTVIYLAKDPNETAVIIYFSPEYMNWEPEKEVNVTGL